MSKHLKIKNFRATRLKAGALLYTLFISLLIFMIVSAVILVVSFGNFYMDTSIVRNQMMLNVESAINYVLTNPEIVTDDNSKEIDLFGEGSDVVTVSQYRWGGYSVLNSMVKKGNYTFSKTGLLGTDFFSAEPVALYMADENSYLSVCGKTLLSGSCYLPKLGVKRAYIEGQSFVGSKLVDGELLVSKSTLPKLNESLISFIKEYLSKNSGMNDSVRYFEEYDQNDSISNSFTNKTLVLEINERVELTNKHIFGNVILKSDYPIVITQSMNLVDVIVAAPTIIIKEGFHGAVQLFASDSIRIEKESVLSFPSFVCLINDKTDNARVFMEIERSCKIDGAVVVIPAQSKKSYLTIGQSVIIRGQVYSDCPVQLSGEIQGSLYCRSFLLKTASSVYENHILNATVNYNALNKYYAGVDLFDENQEMLVIKWVN